MIKSFLLITLLFQVALASSQDLEEIDVFGTNPGNLKAFIHVPENVPENAPLVVALHGCSQTASSMAEQTGWNELAEKYGFMVLYPQQSWTNNVSNCFNWFRSKDIEGDLGELESIYQMIQYCKKTYDMNDGKICVYGLSAGAAMSVAVMANHPTLIDAGAIYAGCPYKMATNAFTAAKVMISPSDKEPEEWGDLIKSMHNYDTKIDYPKLIVLHGDRDNVVDPRSSEELIKQWADLHSIDHNDRRARTDFGGNALIARSEIGPGKEIIYYEIGNTGHAVAVDPGELEHQGGKTGPYAIDRDFFSTYQIAMDFGLIKWK